MPPTGTEAHDSLNLLRDHAFAFDNYACVEEMVVLASRRNCCYFQNTEKFASNKDQCILGLRTGKIDVITVYNVAVVVTVPLHKFENIQLIHAFNAIQ